MFSIHHDILIGYAKMIELYVSHCIAFAGVINLSLSIFLISFLIFRYNLLFPKIHPLHNKIHV